MQEEMETEAREEEGGFNKDTHLPTNSSPIRGHFADILIAHLNKILQSGKTRDTTMHPVTHRSTSTNSLFSNIYYTWKHIYIYIYIYTLTTF